MLGEVDSILAKAARAGDTPDKVLEFIKEHAEEIIELYSRDDGHFAVETGDMIVLCVMLLKMKGYDPEEILAKCYPRFHEKLDGILKTKYI